ncbi:uncharacterized protein LOC111243395 isoform X3 [Varroa destructor]|nr:uncharacterized protein LOC111243395 isoform X3 [Varroa destructor]
MDFLASVVSLIVTGLAPPHRVRRGTTPTMMSQSMASCVQFVTRLLALAVTLAMSRARATTLLDTKASIIYTAVVRGKVALPCNIEPPAKDDEVVLVLWYKDETPAPIFTLDARKANLDRAKQAALSELGSRAYFNMANRPAFLQLDPVKEEDAGEYRCRVDFKKARSINTVINLRVIVPPGEPIIVDGDSKRLRGLVGPYNEGEPLKLTCQAEHGKPRPAVTWWKDYRLLDDSYVFDQDGAVVKNDLEIKALTRNDLLAVLVCQASNNNITVPTPSQITLDLNLKPLDVTIQPVERPLSANKEVELVCTSTGSRPPATLSWWKGNQQIRTTREEDSKGGLSTSTSILTFTPGIEDNNRILACRAENKAIPGSALEQAWKLDVHYAPRASLQLGGSLKADEIQEGKDVYLDCKVQSNPYTNDVGWMFNGVELASNQSSGMIVSSQSLVLQRVTRAHRGKYACHATNKEGKGVSAQFNLRVKFAPVCKEPQRFVYGVSKHESVAIHCQVDSDPQQVSFRWAFNASDGKLKEITEGFTTSSGGRSTLVYRPLSDDDYGQLSCWATNSVGIQRQPCAYTIITAGPPDAVQNCTQVNATEDGMAIECSEGLWDGGLSNPVFVAEVYEADAGAGRGPISNVTTHGLPLFVIRGIPGGASFRVIITASNAKGRSPQFVVMAQTPRPAEKYIADGSTMILAVRPLIGIIVGVVITLTVAAVGLVVALRCRANSSSRQSKLSTHTNEKDSVGGGPDEKPLAVLLKKDPLAMGEELELDCKGPDIIPIRGDPTATLSKKGLSGNNCHYVNLERSGKGLQVDSRYSTLLAGRSEGVDSSQAILTTQLAQDILLGNSGLGTTVDPSQASSVTADYSELVFARSVVALSPPGHPDPLGPPVAPTQPLPPVGGTLGRRGHTAGSGGKVPPTEFARIDFHRTLRPVPGQHLFAATEDHSTYPTVGDIDPSLATEANSGIESTV